MKKLLLLLTAHCGVFAFANPLSAQTWSATTAPFSYWSGVASSGDGVKLAAACIYRGTNLDMSGAIYVSTNSGATWTNSGAPYGTWSAISSSTNGNKLVAAQGYYETSEKHGFVRLI